MQVADQVQERESEFTGLKGQLLRYAGCTYVTAIVSRFIDGLAPQAGCCPVRWTTWPPRSSGRVPGVPRPARRAGDGAHRARGARGGERPLAAPTRPRPPRAFRCPRGIIARRGRAVACVPCARRGHAAARAAPRVRAAAGPASPCAPAWQLSARPLPARRGAERERKSAPG